MCVLNRGFIIKESVAVMSVDLGAEFMKIGIVRPGIPMEIVLNRSINIYFYIF